MNIIYYMSAFCIFIGLSWLLIGLLFCQKSKQKPKKKEIKDASFCVLIPARYESKVIEPLLISLLNQTYPISSDSIYVIVEDRKDPTAEICTKYGINIYVRKNIENRKRKGYALDEAIKNLKKEYDAYVIVDADNILDSDFLKEMNQTYLQGYDIGVGYRNCKNGNNSIIAASSSLTFSMINTLSNRIKSKKNKNIIVSGTGFFIKGTWIKKWNGYPFHSLTEDYELSLYATLYGLTSAYNEKAIFYDEQPISYKESMKQRTRWVRGYFESRREYVPKLKKAWKKRGKNWTSEYQAYVGVKPYLWIVTGILLALFTEVIFFVFSVFQNVHHLLLGIRYMFGLLGLIYFVLFFFTLLLLILERNKINLSCKMKWKTLFFHPIFLISYVECVRRAILKKEISWEAIEHHTNKIC